jgi:hypothetical protein
MAGRHAADDYAAAAHHLGQHREVARDSGPFWAYLDRFTIRGYAGDFFRSDIHRSIIGVIVGVLFIVDGVTRMFTDPGWPSLGVILVGFAVALFCFVFPLLADLAFAYGGAVAHHLHRPRGRRRRRR